MARQRRRFSAQFKAKVAAGIASPSGFFGIPGHSVRRWPAATTPPTRRACASSQGANSTHRPVSAKPRNNDIAGFVRASNCKGLGK